MATVSVSQKCIIPPIFIPPRNLMNIGNSPLYGQEIIKSIETSVGEENTVCVQKVNSTWRITVKTKKVRADILTKGLVVRGHSVQVLSKNPHLIDGQEAVRLMISNIPYEVSEQEIKKALTPLGLKFGSELHWEYYYEQNNASFCKVKTGKRYVFIKPPEKPLPAFIKVLGKYKGYLTLKEEGKKTEKVKDDASGGGHIVNQDGPKPEDQINKVNLGQEEGSPDPIPGQDLGDETDAARSDLGSMASSPAEQHASAVRVVQEITSQTSSVQDSETHTDNKSDNSTVQLEANIPTANRFSTLSVQPDMASDAAALSSTVSSVPVKPISLTGAEEQGISDSGIASNFQESQTKSDHMTDNNPIEGPVGASPDLDGTGPEDDFKSLPVPKSPLKSLPLSSDRQMTLEQFNITANVSSKSDSRASRSKSKGEPGSKTRKGSATPTPKRTLKSPKNTTPNKKCKHTETEGNSKVSDQAVEQDMGGKVDIVMQAAGEQGSYSKGKENGIDWFSLKPIG